MKAIILAGGGGTRLWPVSRQDNPKQVETIVGTRSLLKTTFDRIREGLALEDIFIATGVSHAEKVKSEVPEMPDSQIICEPCRRDTASAIGYAVLRIAQHAPHETFVVINSDAFVRDTEEYHRVLSLADATVRRTPDKTVLVGITPAYAETGYGYIKTGELFERNREDFIFSVDKFVEKPDQKTAEAYLAQGGYLWNPTLIVGQVQHFLSLYKEHLPEHARVFDAMRDVIARDDSEERVAELFSELPSVSIDYGILEKAKGMLVVPADFGWADIGNWRTVRDILASHDTENVVKGKHVGVDSSGNLIYTMSGKLVATAGVSRMVIIETDDVLLVCPQDRAHDVKRIVDELKEETALAQYL